MLAVISDLHFEEEKSDAVVCPGADPISFQRNIKGLAYAQLAARLAGEARRNDASRLDLVLAGDVFDLHRTSMWFMPPESVVRPYVGCGQVDGQLEAKVLDILDAIAAESEVNTALQVFQRLGRRGAYLADPDDPASETAFPVEASIHYLPGNHDRLANATDAIRAKVCGLLGIPVPRSPFPHELRFQDPAVLIRHGHEYDRYNFSADHRYQPPILPQAFPPSEYDDPTLGDFITVEVTSQLAYLFRQHYADICGDRVKAQVYLRLLEFDDVRPQSALVDFVLTMPERDVSPEQAWAFLDPVVRQLLDKIHDSSFLHMWLDRLHDAWHLDAVEFVKLVLAQEWLLEHLNIPLSIVRSAAGHFSRAGTGDPPQAYAAREALVRSGEVRFVIAGHTHNPTMELISVAQKGDRYYVDTGTWRNRVLSTPDRSAFGRLKALTYAVVYGSQEDRGDTPDQPKLESLDYWSGFTQRWEPPAASPQEALARRRRTGP
jgi:UDP-2,3-diacylglucosamine pyrophosphatase LpxH